MLLRLLPLLLSLFSGKILAYEFPIEVFEYLDNTKIVAFINEKDIDAASHWNPMAGAPPLTIADALKGIRQHMASDPKLASAQLLEIELKQIPQHEGHWYYLVKMKSKTAKDLQSHYLIVLMSGKIVPALREPASIK